jgi:hypothetical protein
MISIMTAYCLKKAWRDVSHRRKESWPGPLIDLVFLRGLKLKEPKLFRSKVGMALKLAFYLTVESKVFTALLEATRTTSPIHNSSS